MGKKNKDKKGKGKEKTEQKTEKKAAKRAKKELAEKGEEDIEQMIAEFVAKDKQLTQVIEEKCLPPSPRCNMTLVAHPDREELIMFGGEYYTGKQMYLYNDLFYYNIRKNEWLRVTSPNPPPPRSSHQAVTVAQSGGQMWVFGGEFSNHSQSQFYHYRDLWLLHLKEKRWEQVTGTGRDKTTGPCARSGHRMVAFKNMLVLFGGFHDNSRECKYFNDLWSFDLGTYSWMQLNPLGTGPSPRSGCVLFPALTGSRLLVYGGYSMERVKKDVDQGTTHTDMFALQPEGKGTDGKPVKWRWLPVKQLGSRLSPRCSMSGVVAAGNQAVVFGGVHDEEEDEEQLEGTFYNDMFTLDLDKAHWYSVQLRGSKQTTDKKRRRKVREAVAGGKDNAEGEAMNAENENDSDEMEVAEEDLENLELEEDVNGARNDGNATCGTAVPTVSDREAEKVEGSADLMQAAAMGQTPSSSSAQEDEVFTVTLGPRSAGSAGEGDSKRLGVTETFVPCGRMKPCLAVKNGVLFLYGGTFEEGDKQVTLADFYSLDLGKLDEWKVIIPQDLKQMTWQESDSESEADDADRKHKQAKKSMDDDEDSEDDDDDDDEELTFDDAPPHEEGEGVDEYFGRTQDYWLQQAKNIMEEEGIQLSDRKLLKLAKEICQKAAE